MITRKFTALLLLLLGSSALAPARLPPPILRNSYTTNANPVLSGNGGALSNLNAAAISGVIDPANLPPASGGGGTNVIVSTGPQYYVSPVGNDANSGLTIDTPWTLTNGVAHLAPDVTVNMLPGVYPGGIMVYKLNGAPGHPATLKSLVKWGAVIANSSTYGIACGFTPYASYLVFDGLCISNNLGADGIGIAGNHLTVRNCWITGNWMQGVNSSNPGCSNNVVEYNLIENNGLISFGLLDNHYHGIYIVGPDNIVRGNVVRNNNSGFGIHFYTSDVGVRQNNNWFYDNITYGHTNAYGIAAWSAVDGGSLPGTNYIFNNTVLDAIAPRYGTICISNNIITASPRAVWDPINSASSPANPIVLADYNMSTNVITPDGGHNVRTTDLGFVNRPKGVYWLASTSPARGAAFPSVFGPYGFFGILRSSVADIGAVQYKDSLTVDGRTLDPSPSYGADYWATPSAFVPLTAGGAGGFANGQIAVTNSVGQWLTVGTAAGESTIDFDSQQVRLGHLAGQFATNASGGAAMIGNVAGRFATNAVSSVFVGNGAGTYATNAYEAVLIGDGAGQVATGAKDSLFAGLGTGKYASSANDAVFLGPYAGWLATNANNAILIGNQTGFGAWGADESVFLGNVVGQNANLARLSVMIGTQAGRNATNASRSVFIGNEAGRDVTRPNTLIIDTVSGRSATTNAFIYGEFDNAKLVINGSLYVCNSIYGNGAGLSNLNVAAGSTLYGSVASSVNLGLMQSVDTKLQTGTTVAPITIMGFGDSTVNADTGPIYPIASQLAHRWGMAEPMRDADNNVYLSAAISGGATVNQTTALWPGAYYSIPSGGALTISNFLVSDLISLQGVEVIYLAGPTGGTMTVGADNGTGSFSTYATINTSDSVVGVKSTIVDIAPGGLTTTHLKITGTAGTSTLLYYLPRTCIFPVRDKIKWLNFGVGGVGLNAWAAMDSNTLWTATAVAKPDLLFFHLRHEGETTFANMNKITGIIRSAAPTCVIGWISTLPPGTGVGSDEGTDVAGTNAAVRNWCLTNNAMYVDIYGLVPGATNSWLDAQGWYQPDGSRMHVLNTGYDTMLAPFYAAWGWGGQGNAGITRFETLTVGSGQVRPTPLTPFTISSPYSGASLQVDLQSGGQGVNLGFGSGGAINYDGNLYFRPIPNGHIWR